MMDDALINAGHVKTCMQINSVRCQRGLLEYLQEMVSGNEEYRAAEREYKSLFEQLISELSESQQKALLRLDELAAQHEALNNEIVLCEIMGRVCQNVCQE